MDGSVHFMSFAASQATRPYSVAVFAPICHEPSISLPRHQTLTPKGSSNPVKNLDKASPLEKVLEQDILQLTPFFTADYEQQLMAHLTQCISGRWHPEFTDITANGADKGKGILAIAQHEGLDPDHTIAFGDGGNDTSMIRQAGIGIAMGNAIDELKQQADYVTSTVDEDGILNALRHFGIV